MDIEENLKDFLRSGKKLEYEYSKAEPGYVGLCTLEELNVGEVWIEGPGEGKNYYSIPAVNLTNENEYYDPEYILLWLPNERKYGTWDSDHWILYVFPNACWDDIAQNPLPYINCQWDLEQLVGQEFDPRGKYDLKEGKPF